MSKCRNRFSEPMRVIIHGVSETAVKQEFEGECDINEIVARAKRGIAPAWLAKGAPRYGDFSSVPTLAEAFEKVSLAREAFMTLPSQLRWELGNDPRRIDELTAEQCVRFKLVKQPAEPAVTGSEGGTPSRASDGQDDPSKPKGKTASKQSDQV